MAKGDETGGRKGQGVVGGLRRTGGDVAPHPRTQTELEQATRDLVDRLNEAVRTMGAAQDKLASFVFKAVFGDDVKAAFDQKRATPAYRLLRKRAGNSLDLDKTELSRYVRIGALNYELQADAWANLDWSKKVELLPLANRKDGHRKLRAGMKHAMGQGIGVRQLRKWVANALPVPRTKPPRELGLGAGERFTSVGVQLGNADDRARLVTQVREAPKERRRAFLRELKETARNLGALLRELEAE